MQLPSTCVQSRSDGVEKLVGLNVRARFLRSTSTVVSRSTLRRRNIVTELTFVHLANGFFANSRRPVDSAGSRPPLSGRHCVDIKACVARISWALQTIRSVLSPIHPTGEADALAH